MKGWARGRLSVLGHWEMAGTGAILKGQEELEKAQGTLWGGPPKMCCGAWEIPPRRMGVIKAWAVPLERGGVRRGGPGSTMD